MNNITISELKAMIDEMEALHGVTAGITFTIQPGTPIPGEFEAGPVVAVPPEQWKRISILLRNTPQESTNVIE